MADRLPPRVRDPSLVETLMLRFRPIAPKPMNTDPRRGATVDSVVKARPKRKYFGSRRRRDLGQAARARSTQSKGISEGSSGLLSMSKGSRGEHDDAPRNSRVDPGTCSLLPDLNDAGSPYLCKRVLNTWLIVESVAATDDRVGLLEHPGGTRIATDEEKVRGLAGDACPGFVTDEGNMIRWVNGACERMVRERLAADGGWEGAVWMVAKEELPCWSPGFTCRVRMLHTWKHDDDEGCPGARVGAVTVAPCDAWRLGSGGFAWRLDVEAALTLGGR